MFFLVLDCVLVHVNQYEINASAYVMLGLNGMFRQRQIYEDSFEGKQCWELPAGEYVKS